MPTSSAAVVPSAEDTVVGSPVTPLVGAGSSGLRERRGLRLVDLEAEMDDDDELIEDGDEDEQDEGGLLQRLHRHAEREARAAR